MKKNKARSIISVEAFVEDIRSILSMYKSKHGKEESATSEREVSNETPSWSEIPDIFFDEILNQFKLSRTEIS
ncbi:MAG: hypothetical protein ACK5XN_32345, partial [Bacteroidota bacterium]